MTENNRDYALYILFIILILALGFAIGALTISFLAKTHYQQQAIEQGCAGYDRTTGKFQWHQEKMK